MRIGILSQASKSTVTMATLHFVYRSFDSFMLFYLKSKFIFSGYWREYIVLVILQKQNQRISQLFSPSEAKVRLKKKLSIVLFLSILFLFERQTYKEGEREKVRERGLSSNDLLPNLPQQQDLVRLKPAPGSFIWVLPGGYRGSRAIVC